MRIIGVCFVLLGCAGMGMYYRMREIFRYRNLQELLKAMMVLRGEIAAIRTPLPEALLHSSRRIKGSIAAFFRLVAGDLEEGRGELNSIWKSRLKDTIPLMQMKEADRTELERLGETLGYLDVEMQVQSIDLYKKRLEYSIKEMEKENEKRSRLYPVLGTITGILLCILIL